MAAKRASDKAKSEHVVGQARKPAKMFRAGLYARVSINDQQTLPMQSRTMREYAARRGWTIALQVREVSSGAARREAREKLIEAARRREFGPFCVAIRHPPPTSRPSAPRLALPPANNTPHLPSPGVALGRAALKPNTAQIPRKGRER
jgi:hypothetical protein